MRVTYGRTVRFLVWGSDQPFRNHTCDYGRYDYADLKQYTRLVWSSVAVEAWQAGLPQTRD
jgi:hypothetical protein